MPSVADALKQYGFVGTLANSVPELKKILTQATTGAGAPWSADEFSRAVQDSKWWKNTEDNKKQYAILKATKPGEFKAQRLQLETKVRTLAAEMGVRTFGGAFAHVVDSAQQHGYDEATIRQMVGHYLGTRAIQKGVAFGGQAGEVQQQIRSLYYDMGVPYSGYTTNAIVRDVLEGKTTVQAVQASVQTAAKSRFPSLSAQIDAGQTVRQIADPYIQTQAQLLEVAPGKIGLQDPLVKKGLSQRDSKGQLGMMPLWQYEQEVRKDPRWDQTKNARDQYATMAHQIGRDWGFTS